MTLPARGTPDWGIPNYEASAAQVDLGQVLSGLYHFDRADQRGRVSVVETWAEGSNSWILVNFGTGILPAVVVAPSVAFVGPGVMKLDPGGGGGDYSQIDRSIHLGASKRIGLEVGLLVSAGMGEFQIECEYRLAASATRYIMRMIYDPITGNWLLNTATGDVVIVNRPTAAVGIWHQIKFVGDWTKGEYVSVIIGDTLFDVASLHLPMLASGMTEGGRCTIAILTYGNTSGGHGPVYIGYVVLTRDEP